MRLRKVAALAASVTFLVAFAAVPLSAVPAAAVPVGDVITASGTDWVSAGVGGIEDGSGDIEVSGVKGTVTAAYLFWHGVDMRADGVYDAAEIFFDKENATEPRRVTGVPRGDAPSNGWPNSGKPLGSSRAYRADVTDTVSGNGLYSLDGLRGREGTDSPSGASLVVLFDDDDDSNNRDIYLYSGNDSNTFQTGFPGEAAGWSASLAGIEYAGGSATIQLHAADGQRLADGTVTVGGPGGVATLADSTSVWDGTSVPSAGTLRPGTTGRLWDIGELDITSALSPGANTLTLSGLEAVTDGVDALSLVVAIVDVPAVPVLNMGVPSATFSESAGTVSIPLALSAPSGVQVTAAISSTDGSATAGDDYVVFRPTIDAGDTSGEILVEIVDDGADEIDETFTVTITDPVGATLGPLSETAVTITDDDVPVVSMASSAVSVRERDGQAAVGVELHEPAVRPVTVEFTTLAGSALAGQDYQTTSGTLTIPAGQTQRSISVPVLDNTDNERDESFTVRLSAPSGAALGTPASTVVTIVDDDVPRVAMAAPSLSVQEPDGSASVGVVLSPPAVVPVTVEFATSAGSAAAGQDFQTRIGTLTIPAGQTQGSISVPVLDDGTDEVPETFSVTLSAPSRAVLGTPATTEVTIVDDDEPRVAMAAPSLTVPEPDGPASVGVVLSSPAVVPVMVEFATSAGSAAAGQDFQTRIGTLTIPAGQTQGSISVPVLDDGTDEVPETFSVTLSAPSGAVLGTPATTEVTIVDGDEPRVAMAAPSLTVQEPDGPASVGVVLSSPAVGPVTVEFATSAGSAAAGQDFETRIGTLTIPAGETQGSISVPVLDDGTDEVPETFSVTLSALSGAVLGTPATSEVTIVDDDVPRVAMAGPSLSVREPDGSASIEVALSSPAVGPVTVEFATAAGSAAAGDDFESGIDKLTFLAGQTRRSISVAVLDDSTDESAETFTLTLSSPSGAGLGTPVTTVVTILDDDPPAVIARDDSGTTTSGGRVRIAVTANDDNTGGLFLALGPGTPGGGSATIDGSEVVYDADADFVGVDTFDYALSDGVDRVATATVRVTVLAPSNRPPVAGNDTAKTAPETAVVIAVLANDTDPEDDLDPASLRVQTGPGKGSSVVAAGHITYTPDQGVSGTTDTFIYAVSDSGGLEGVATVTVSIGSKTVLVPSAASAPPGGSVQVTGGGCSPNAKVNVTVDGQPRPGGQAAGNGTYTINVLMPATVGRHLVQTTCGEVVNETVVDTVSTTSAPSVGAPAVAAAAMAITGGVLVFFLLYGFVLVPIGGPAIRQQP